MQVRLYRWVLSGNVLCCSNHLSCNNFSTWLYRGLHVHDLPYFGIGLQLYAAITAAVSVWINVAGDGAGSGCIYRIACNAKNVEAVVPPLAAFAGCAEIATAAFVAATAKHQAVH